VERSASYDYGLFLPSNYNQDAHEKFPIILSLHGVGGMILSSDHTTMQSSPEGLGKQLTSATFRANFPAIVISPHCRGIGVSSGDCWFTMEALDHLFEDIKRRYRYDSDRIYVMGLSGGSIRGAAFAARHDEEIAALVAIAGNMDGNLTKTEGGLPLPDAHGDHICDLNNLYVWAVHGLVDPTVPPGGTTAMETQLTKTCPSPRRKIQITLHPGAGHNTWDRTFSDSKTYDWLFSKRKSMNADLTNAKPVVSAGVDRTVSAAAGGTATFNGTASDPDSSIAATTWVLEGKVSKTVNKTIYRNVTTGLNATVTKTAPPDEAPDGTTLPYTFRYRLIVTDVHGVSSFDDAYLRVNP
jgi:alpha-beta hydrolase superfamily lysophospholipase